MSLSTVFIYSIHCDLSISPLSPSFLLYQLFSVIFLYSFSCLFLSVQLSQSNGLRVRLCVCLSPWKLNHCTDSRGCWKLPSFFSWVHVRWTFSLLSYFQCNICNCIPVNQWHYYHSHCMLPFAWSYDLLSIIACPCIFSPAGVSAIGP